MQVLLEKLDNKMKATVVENTVPSLFEGKMTSFIKCKNVNCTSSRSETFYDIQLSVRGKKNSKCLIAELVHSNLTRIFSVHCFHFVLQ